MSISSDLKGKARRLIEAIDAYRAAGDRDREPMILLCDLAEIWEQVRRVDPAMPDLPARYRLPSKDRMDIPNTVDGLMTALDDAKADRRGAEHDAIAARLYDALAPIIDAHVRTEVSALSETLGGHVIGGALDALTQLFGKMAAGMIYSLKAEEGASAAETLRTRLEISRQIIADLQSVVAAYLAKACAQAEEEGR